MIKNKSASPFNKNNLLWQLKHPKKKKKRKENNEKKKSDSVFHLVNPDEVHNCRFKKEKLYLKVALNLNGVIITNLTQKGK